MTAQKEPELNLKLCPFCRSKKITIEKWIGYYARCNKCGCCFPDSDSKELAVKIWNTRKGYSQ